ncbi:hypothetical protein ACWCPM_07555 [Streptomyces sp. NPDC002309]
MTPHDNTSSAPSHSGRSTSQSLAPATAGQAARILHRRVQRAGESLTAWRAATVVVRLALAAGFLSAVADRWGLWGAQGTDGVAWGTFGAFVDYTGDLAPYLSGWLLDTAAVATTAAELLLGLALFLGLALRWTAWLSAGLLAVFGLSMAFFMNPQAPLSYSVFSAGAAAALLALAPQGSLTLTLDEWLTNLGRRADS